MCVKKNSIIIGLCHIKMRMPETFSLKDKRRILKGVKKRLHTLYNLSVAEVNHQNDKRLSDLALVAVGTDRDIVHRMFMGVLRFVENDGRSEIMDFYIEWL